MTFEDQESALILPVPESEFAVETLREQFDPTASEGLCAHITLIYPFQKPNLITNSLLVELGKFFGQIKVFDYSLVSIEMFPATVYLDPNPSDKIRSMVEKLEKKYPDTPPYGGIHDSIIPHLTVAGFVEFSNMKKIESLVRKQIEKKLPIPCKAQETWLIVKNHGIWDKKATFRLA